MAGFDAFDEWEEFLLKSRVVLKEGFGGEYVAREEATRDEIGQDAPIGVSEW